MNVQNTITVSVMGMVLISILVTLAAQAAIAGGIDPEDGWIATGTVTKLDGYTFFFLGKDNNVYKIDASKAVLFIEDFMSDNFTAEPGDTVRIYGKAVGPRVIEAIRVRILKRERSSGASTAPEKQVSVIVENKPNEVAQAESVTEAVEECSICPEGSWNAQGIVVDVDYTGHRVKLQTVGGTYSINVGRTLLINGSERISLAVLNIGDVIRISGNLVGFNEVNAQQLKVLTTRIASDAAIPQTPVSVAGIIQSIDYASLTFKMRTGAMEILVATDDSTRIQQHQLAMSFMNLRSGMRVKMSGNGAPGTGYAAKHILIISVSP